jgi:hypothetical protein
MYAVIFDDHAPHRIQKPVISVHRTRRCAEEALRRHRRTHGRDFQQCRWRVVWTLGRVRSGDTLTPGQFDTWRPGEAVPEGELRSDMD